MRVIAGTLGGRTLATPRGRGTRPTSDRVREALFSALGDIGGARVLDLFAGSGALGIEALSRGAAEAVFVDSSRSAAEVIRANLSALGLKADVRALPAQHFLARAPEGVRQYDLVFIDPPYALAPRLAPELQDLLPAMLADGARVVVESDRRTPLALTLPLRFERRYGDTLIRIHEHTRLLPR